MDFDKASKLALEIKAAYAAQNARNGLDVWRSADFALGLVGDVGDLAKLVMAEDGKRQPSDRDALAHELCDCLWSILVLADESNIDLAQRYPMEMKRLLGRLAV